MCHYCYLKKLKKWARGAKQKARIEFVGTVHEIRMRPRNYRYSFREELMYREQEGDIFTTIRIPDGCECLTEVEGDWDHV